MKKLATLSFAIFVASSAVAAAQTAPFVAGKVVKIDTSAGKVAFVDFATSLAAPPDRG